MSGSVLPSSSFLRSRMMKISTVRVSYSCSRCQMRSQISSRLKTRPGSAMKTWSTSISRGESATAAAINEQFKPRLAVAAAKPHVVRRAFIAECWRNRDVNCEMLLVSKGERKLPRRICPFV